VLNTNNTTKLRVNKKLTILMKTSTRICQEDSLSPLLFNIVMEQLEGTMSWKCHISSSRNIVPSHRSHSCPDLQTFWCNTCPYISARKTAWVHYSSISKWRRLVEQLEGTVWTRCHWI